MSIVMRLNNWLDCYDPYWYSRLMSLKIGYITIILFIANMFLSPPLAPLVMLLSGAGVLIIEMPSINDLDKKDNLYLAYIIIICLTVGLFSSYVYLKAWFIVVASGWCYILYNALKKKPELFPIVGVILMLGIMSLEGYNSGNFFDILNRLFFILEFALIVFWAHKFFPNLYHKIWLAATIRNLASLQQMLTKISVDGATVVLKHNFKARNVAALLKRKVYYSESVQLTNLLAEYYFYVADLILNKTTPSPELNLIANDLGLLESAIRQKSILNQIHHPRSLIYSSPTSSKLRHKSPTIISNQFEYNDSAQFNGYHNHPDLAIHNELFPRLYYHWNKICAHVNS
ncbi:MAG: hypothetical protein K2X04_06730 [Burkholderiales bacterium]|nr:hypothetical protein [Burkholderiales bacterium]